MEQPWDNNDGIGANPSPEGARPQSPQAALPQGPISEVIRVLIPPLRSFAQDFYNLPFLPTDDDLNRILWHNGELGWAPRNIQPSELVQFLRRPRHEPRDLLVDAGDELHHNQAPIQAEDFGESDETSISHRDLFQTRHLFPTETYSNVASADPQLAPNFPFNLPAASLSEQPHASPPAESPNPPLAEPPPAPSNESPADLPADPPASQEPAAPLPPYHTATFPPGRDLPGFVPFGRMRPASSHQGNHWPIEPELRGEIVHAELDNYKRRPGHQRLTYGEILEKYDRWNPVEGVKGGVVASTLRGYNRRYTIPDKQNRVRRPQWQGQHLRALRKAVPGATNRKGNISWKKVRESVEATTGRPFGLATLSAKWRQIKGKSSGEYTEDEHSEGGEEKDEEGEEEEGMEGPDDEPRLDDGRKRDGDDDDDDSATGGATQAPGSARNRLTDVVA